MKIAIIDDMAGDREELLNILLPLLHTFDFSIETFEYSSGEDFLETFLPYEFDICFLDIYMNEMNGMDVAKIISQKDPNCYIIFLTTSPDYILQGYDVRAWRYLLKPLDPALLKKALTSCIDKIVASKRFLEVRIDMTDVKIPYSKLFLVNVIGRNVELHFEDHKISLSSKITFAEISKTLLADRRFVLCNKGTVVNLLQIKTMNDHTITMKNGETVDVSRRRLTETKNSFLKFTIENIL